MLSLPGSLSVLKCPQQSQAGEKTSHMVGIRIAQTQWRLTRERSEISDTGKGLNRGREMPTSVFDVRRSVAGEAET